MTPAHEDWTPDPVLLAAYFDGELTGGGDLEALRGRIAGWLREHPEAREVFADYRRLAQLWHDSPPADPGSDAWDELATRLDCGAGIRRGGWGRRAFVLLATAAGIALLFAFAISERWLPARTQAKVQRRAPVAPAEVEVFPVATAAEVTILRVEGADTHTLVVGELPLAGMLELAGPGDVALTSVQPDARDQMMPNIRLDGPRAPLIWARVEPE